MKIRNVILLTSLILFFSACSQKDGVGGTSTDVTAEVQKRNAEFVSELNLNDQQAFKNAKRGFIARPTGKLLDAEGNVLRDFDAYQFLKGKAPATVNPSLWRHAQLNAGIGLFKVTDGVYQLRGFDLANITLIQGRTGWIVVDALTSSESAAAAMNFAHEHLGKQPVTALIFTHSHIDHFGGALGIATSEEIEQRQIPVIASEGFMEEATSENIMVGPVMGRRSIYQFGRDLEHSAKGNIDTGLGKDVVYGTFGILPPTKLITQPTEEVILDGVRFVFHNVPGAEAPAELTFSVPEIRLYGGAENLAMTMHNLLPVRGAKVRDALRWANYLQEALDQLGDADIYVGQHNWPIWGQERIVDFITKQRDVYKYTHDQTVRMMNAGLTPREIADTIRLPKSLQEDFGMRGYYGNLRHNSKAVYQFYLGAYDGNPVNLDLLPPQESAKRYLEIIGGADKAVAAAQDAFDKGDYRWTAELLNHVVFGEPKNIAAKKLLARTYDQLGYLSEAATWRNSYLAAANELRNGPPKKGISHAGFVGMLNQTSVERFLEAMAASLNGPAAEGVDLKINLVLSDIQESYVLWIENAVLHFKKAPAADNANANATLTLTKSFFIKMITGTAGVKDVLMSDDLKVSGSRIDLARFFSLLDKAPGNFAIVTKE